MGQYFKAVSITKRQWVNPRDYDCFTKLTENAWLPNPFVLAVEGLLAKGGAWHKNRIVWAGDYAPQMKYLKREDKPVYAEWYARTEPEWSAKHPSNLIPNVYDTLAVGKEREPFMFVPIKPKRVGFKRASVDYRFIINHTKKEFVDKSKVPDRGFGWYVHPLPILCASGNGEGNGDYYVDDKNKDCEKYIGSWVNNRISVAPEAPAGYTEIVPNFK